MTSSEKMFRSTRREGAAFRAAAKAAADQEYRQMREAHRQRSQNENL